MLHTFSVYVRERPGVLNRVAALFRQRGINIESLTVGHTQQLMKLYLCLCRRDNEQGRQFPSPHRRLRARLQWKNFQLSECEACWLGATVRERLSQPIFHEKNGRREKLGPCQSSATDYPAKLYSLLHRLYYDEIARRAKEEGLFVVPSD